MIETHKNIPRVGLGEQDIFASVKSWALSDKGRMVQAILMRVHVLTEQEQHQLSNKEKAVGGFTPTSEAIESIRDELSTLCSCVGVENNDVSLQALRREYLKTLDERHTRLNSVSEERTHTSDITMLN